MDGCFEGKPPFAWAGGACVTLGRRVADVAVPAEEEGNPGGGASGGGGGGIVDSNGTCGWGALGAEPTGAFRVLALGVLGGPGGVAPPRTNAEDDGCKGLWVHAVGPLVLSTLAHEGSPPATGDEAIAVRAAGPVPSTLRVGAPTSTGASGFTTPTEGPALVDLRW